MKVYSWDEITQDGFKLSNHFASDKFSALAIGAFDGPHLGHQSLFDTVLSQETLLHGLVTFSRSPRAVKQTANFEGDVSTLRLRLERFAKLGFDFVLVIDFSGNFGTIKGRDFLMVLTKSLCMRFLTVGPSFRCGHNLDTGESEISAFAVQNNVSFVMIHEVVANGKRISSTLIRYAAGAGDFVAVRRLLGFSYRLDMIGLEGEKTSTGYIWKKNVLTQIIPPVGQYNVCIETVKSDSGFPVCYLAGILIVEEEYLRSLFYIQETGTFVQTIIFGNSEKKE